MQKLMRTQTESVVVLLKNMVTADEVDDELQVCKKREQFILSLSLLSPIFLWQNLPEFRRRFKKNVQSLALLRESLFITRNSPRMTMPKLLSRFSSNSKTRSLPRPAKILYIRDSSADGSSQPKFMIKTCTTTVTSQVEYGDIDFSVKDRVKI